MIELTFKISKYREFCHDEINKFQNQSELEQWIDDIQEYTDDIKIESDECGEDLSKWSATFEYKGTKYNVYLDI
jgi:hypothetical protein